MAIKELYHSFLSHSHQYSDWVEALARRLEDEYQFRIWLDRWVLIPGESWQQKMARGLEEAATCAVCLGEKTPTGWFRQEAEKALNRQAADPGFRVIPVLLPDAPFDLSEVMPAFLDLRTWVDYREGQDLEYAFHVLAQGIKGEPIGRWPPSFPGGPGASVDNHYSVAERKLQELRKLRAVGEISETVRIEYEQKILARWFGE
jgi:hypothetical protein